VIPKELGKPLTLPCQTSRIRFSPEGGLFAAAHDGSVLRWDVSGKDPKALPAVKLHDGWTTDVLFHPTKPLAISTDSHGAMVAWDRTAEKPSAIWKQPKAHDGWLRTAHIHDGSIITIGRDGCVRVWNLDDGKPQRELSLGIDLFSIAVAPGGKSLAVGDFFGTIHEIDRATLKPTRKLEVKELHLLDRIQDVGGVRVLAFKPDGKSLFVAGSQPKTGGFVQGFPLVVELEWTTGKRLSQWKGAADSEGFIHDLLWLEPGILAGVTSGQPGQGKLFVWKPGDVKPQFESAKLSNCHSLALHPNGKLLAHSGTNANSSGNGKVKGKDGDYPANTSPIQLWTLG
jgi:WD40 repeat protein